jgi:signal transduction histidine kinase
MDTATDSQRIALTQVVRESLANAIRHGDPDTIQVRLCGDEHTLRLQVIDDGCGFDPKRLADKRPDGRQVGIAGMRERLRLLGGSLTIESRRGGCTATLTQPTRSRSGARVHGRRKRA